MSDGQGPLDPPQPPAPRGSDRRENILGAVGCLVLLPIAGVVAIAAVGVLVSDPAPWIAFLALVVALSAFAAAKRRR